MPSLRRWIGLLATGVALAVALVALPPIALDNGHGFVVPIVRAASPMPSPETGGDTRSSGAGPGFVGAPLLAILGVLVLGIGTAAVTLVYVRLTGGPRNRPPPDG